MGPDQESLLPPEVVPLDPQVATKMSQTQAASRAMSSTDAVPGMAPGAGSNNIPAGLPAAATQSPQDFRQAAFNNLMGQPVAPAAPPVNPNLQMMQAQMAPGMNQAPGMAQQGQVGQSAWVTPGLNQSGMSPNQAAGGMQSQTLSGGVKNPEIGRPSKLSKLSHGIGLATMLGSGVVVGAAMSRNPASLYSTGLFGLGVAQYGLRNGLSRF